TVYGLAANALDAGAVQSIFRAKGRPSDNPLIVHVSSVRMLRALYHLPAAGTAEASRDLPFLGSDAPALESPTLRQRLRDAEEEAELLGGEWPEIPRVYHDAIRRFWPGPLTIVVPRPPCIPLAVTGGAGATVAVRLPAHPVARAIIAACGLPLAAPSANASGRPSPTTAAHVAHDLQGRSTVVDAFSSTARDSLGRLAPCVLRPGGVTVEALRSLGGDWALGLRVYRRDFACAALENAPTTPGMKYRHYSPTAPVLLVAAGPAQRAATRAALCDLHARDAATKIGVVALDDVDAPAGCALIVHRVADARDLAHRIFALLRELDETDHVDAIVVQGVDDADEGLAVMNRLEKAASRVIAAPPPASA
ncbi:hypothetical protein GGI02_004949, partial [Coemansia sp. RSA 2322]